MAEEFKNQMGDHLPGALKVGAKTMGVTTKEFMKMMENGELLTDEFLPKFFKEYSKITDPALIKAVNSLGAAQGRLANAWNDMQKNLMSTAFGKAVTEIHDSMVDVITVLDAAMKGFLGDFLGGIITGVTFPFRLIAALIRDIVMMTDSWSDTTQKIVSFFSGSMGIVAGAFIFLKLMKMISSTAREILFTMAAIKSLGVLGALGEGLKGKFKKGAGAGTSAGKPGGGLPNHKKFTPGKALARTAKAGGIPLLIGSALGIGGAEGFRAIEHMIQKHQAKEQMFQNLQGVDLNIKFSGDSITQPMAEEAQKQFDLQMRSIEESHGGA